MKDIKQRNDHYKKAIAACMKGIQCVSNKNAPILWINMIDVMIGQLTFFSFNINNDNDNDSKMQNNNDDNESDSDSDSDIDIDDDK